MKPLAVVLLAFWIWRTGSAFTQVIDKPIDAVIFYNEKEGFVYSEEPLANLNRDDYLAWGNFDNKINSTGWSYLEVNTNSKFSDKIQAYAAGYLEGVTTSKILYMHYVNTVQGYCNGEMEKVCEKLKVYISKNTEWVKSKFSHHCPREDSKSCSPYWHHTSLVYEQIDGLEAGYARVAEQGVVPAIPKGAILFMNIFGDMEDLSQALVAIHGLNVTLPHTFGDGHCSALIKLLPGNQDLLSSHVTWNSYQSMIRIIKKYDLGLHMKPKGKLIPGQKMAFSGYPGVIYSGDDFSVIHPSGLTTIETTIGNSNKTLWKFVKPIGQILEGVRATVANRLAWTGKQWTHIFAKHNSGTYNNQWMIIDYKLFKPGKPLTKGLLWILEQLPGHVHAEDKTDLLKSQSYWPSYNTPYFQSIYNISGNPELAKKYGNWFTYDKTPRALIFKRDQGKVVDLDSMTKLMRYNNFQKDPLSRCNCTPPFSAENAISARNDLNPKNGTYPFGSLGHRSHGGTDMKVTSYDMMKKLQFQAVSGPTYDDLPAFQWSKTDFAKDCPHVGHPDIWAFKPLIHEWESL